MPTNVWVPGGYTFSTPVVDADGKIDRLITTASNADPLLGPTKTDEMDADWTALRALATLEKVVDGLARQIAALEAENAALWCNISELQGGQPALEGGQQGPKPAEKPLQDLDKALGSTKSSQNPGKTATPPKSDAPHDCVDAIRKGRYLTGDPWR